MRNSYEDELYEEELEEIEDQLENDEISVEEAGFSIGEIRGHFRRGADDE